MQLLRYRQIGPGTLSVALFILTGIQIMHRVSRCIKNAPSTRYTATLNFQIDEEVKWKP